MPMVILVVGIALTVVAVGAAVTQQNRILQILTLVGALFILFLTAAMSSSYQIKEDEIGILIKNFGRELPTGAYIATDGEKGPQSRTLGPGWHFFIWPLVYDVEVENVINIEEGRVGLMTAKDGQPLPNDMAFAPEWDADTFGRMVYDSTFFLGEGQGYKGPQSSILKPGVHRINLKLFDVVEVPATNVKPATVAVIKSNVGERLTGAAVDADGQPRLVETGQRGIWAEPLHEGLYYLNAKAYEVTTISTQIQIASYVDASRDETAIEVRTLDGFTFPVDVRVSYQISPDDAPLVVKMLRDDQENLRENLRSAVRAVFRNNAERVKAINYVQERSTQEESSTELLKDRMASKGVTILQVEIGAIGNEQSLGELLKTQTDREIAVQELETFKQQELAAAQQKKLSRTEQEAEEERRLATAEYEVKIAEQDQQKRIIEAEAEAQAIEIQAAAQAEAFRVIAEQIGKGNAATIELLKIVGEAGVNITPKVMVIGGGGGGGGNGNGAASSSSSDETSTALLGTMLNRMIEADEAKESP